MKILIVEDSFVTREMLRDILSPYGDCTVTVNGEEAVYAFNTALEEEKPYDLICLDIMLPMMDGQKVLKRIRSIERSAGIPMVNEVRVLMITACDDPKTVVDSYYRGGATSYLVKPFNEAGVKKEVYKLFPLTWG